MRKNFSVTNTTKSKPPSLLFANMKEFVLGKEYDLSLVFIGDYLSKKLNTEHRNKSYTPNILSFPLSKTDGEIFMNLNKIKKDAKKIEKGYNDFIKILFIHGLLHLKGFKHGKKMEKEEEILFKKFN